MQHACNFALPHVARQAKLTFPVYFHISISFLFPGHFHFQDFPISGTFLFQGPLFFRDISERSIFVDISEGICLCPFVFEKELDAERQRTRYCPSLFERQRNGRCPSPVQTLPDRDSLLCSTVCTSTPLWCGFLFRNYGVTTVACPCKST